jgi:hypothetical protein
MPEPVDDPLLGHLDWDDRLDWWGGSIEFRPGHRVDIFVEHDDDGRTEEEIALARRSLARIREREPEYRLWSARQLHGKRWNTEEEMTVEDIARLLELATLEFAPNGTARIFWNDQDVLFAGHNVLTELDATGQCVTSGMQ